MQKFEIYKEFFFQRPAPTQSTELNANQGDSEAFMSYMKFLISVLPLAFCSFLSPRRRIRTRLHNKMGKPRGTDESRSFAGAQHVFSYCTGAELAYKYTQ